MTTVVDPSGTPVPVYNRSGVTIVAITANNAGDPSQDNATAIPRHSGLTVALVTCPDNNNRAVKLPSDAEIGDVVEVYQMSSSYPAVYAESGGATIGILNATDFINVSGGIFRKVASGRWQAVWSPS
jgi:hypothetical protein